MNLYDGEFITDSNIVFESPKTYEIDFDKVKTNEDIIAILKGLNIVYSAFSHSIPDYFRPYLKEVE